ncbi:MAG TPA: AI-2E family transporter [Alloacidobacterium sp.]|nr:AI-2E family transporter [Alloacidobacterium sp.]
MTTEQPSTSNKEFIRRALEVAIHVGLLVLLTTACLFIVRPFLPLVTWGIVIAIASYPAYRKLRGALGGRGKLAAVLCTLFFLAALIVPVALLAETMIEGARSLGTHVKDGTLSIPAPPASVRTWPLIGAPLDRVWNMAYTNLTGLLKSLAPQLREFVPRLLHTSAGIGITVIQFVLAILVAGAMLANASGCAAITHALANRLFGERGPEFEQLAGSTIRSVTNGIIGVAVIQAIFAGIGFLVAGLPGAGLWTLAFLIGAILQIGGLVILPAIIYMFAIASTTKAVLFLVWCLVVLLLEHVLKPLLLGRGVAVPIVVVFLGAIGGFLAIGIIGLFVGAIVLSVGYKLFLAWIEGPIAAEQAT